MAAPSPVLLTHQDLLRHLKQLGIELYAEGETLRFRAQKDAFTPELRELVQSRKPELLALLQHSGVPEAASSIPGIDRSRPVRMSSGQERIWFLYRFEGPSSTYNITPVFRLRGRLSLEALRRTFTALVERHETLRMRFSEQEGFGVQIIDAPSELPVQTVSLVHLAPSQRMAAVERIILEQTAQPFDLERGPVLRVTLIVLDSEDHILLPFMHHIIGDGWSLGVLHREFGLLYDGFVSGYPRTLDPLPVQYPDFAAWQRARQESDEGRDALGYWRQQLAGAPQTLALPLDFERPAAVTFNGRVLRRTIPADIIQSIAKLGRAQDCSMFMVLLAAYGVLMHRHSGQEDILIGSPVAGRVLRETEPLIGCFVNTLVLRIRLHGNPGFLELLQQVRQTALDAYSHQDVPVEAVIDAVIRERDPRRIPLFQTQFSLQNVPSRAAPLSSLNVEVMQMDRVAAKNDLSFILENRFDGILAELEFNSDLFREETVHALGEDYVRLLEAIAGSPDQRILELPLASNPRSDTQAFATQAFAQDQEEEFDFE
jgi:hypothetical protein